MTFSGLEDAFLMVAVLVGLALFLGAGGLIQERRLHRGRMVQVSS